jgi:hypothetical protein
LRAAVLHFKLLHGKFKKSLIYQTALVNKNIEQPITEHEIEQAIRKTKIRKAPGIDNINPEIIKKI